MKHNLRVISLLALFFLLSQVVGLFIIDAYIDHEHIIETGELGYVNLPGDNERPPVEESDSVWYILGAILIGTVILLIIIHFKKTSLWRLWYFFSVAITLTIAFSAFMYELLALVLGLILGIWKVFRPNLGVHNLTELFIYGGLAAIFVPIMNLSSAVMLLILISVYDMYAVWKSKHMVKLAEFTSESKVFAGLSVPYDKKSGHIEMHAQGSLSSKTAKIKTAILGGGDIGFPLLFTGVVFKGLVLTHSLVESFLISSIISISTTIALLMLFLKGDKNKFYPAMPFVSVGCFVGYGLVWLLTNFLG